MRFTISLISFLFLFQLQAKIYVISDIDDTIKKANSVGGVVQVWHFFKKKVFFEMRDLFLEIESYYQDQGEEVQFHYVSAAPDAIFNQQRWIKKHNFPYGPTYLRRKGSGDTYTHKTNAIKKILKGFNASEDTVYFFGDNASLDSKVYTDIKKEYSMESAFIFIRDVSTKATDWSFEMDVVKEPGAYYFFSEMELLNAPGLFFMSENLKMKILRSYKKEILVPEYTFKVLYKRIRREKSCGLRKICRYQAEAQADRLWNEYHARF